MASAEKKIVDSSSVGNPPKKMLEDVETLRYTIYDFKKREEQRGESIESPILKAHGYDWVIQIFPRGSPKSSIHTECITSGIYLSPDMIDKNVTVDFLMRIKHFTTRNAKTNLNSNSRVGWGFNDLLNREDVLANYLEEDDSLIIEVDLKIAAEDRKIWYPKELNQQDSLVELYREGLSETSDIIFSVGTATYHAHKSILNLRCQKLYEFAEEYSDSESTVIPIFSMRAEIFKSILEFVYTVKTPELKNVGVATELLVASDCYGIIDLKLYSESVLVDKFLDATNAAALLILADSHSCALLKEAAIQWFITDGETMRKAKEWSLVQQSNMLLEELLNACSRKILGKGDLTNGDKIEILDVTTLRKKLDDANLELDGSREILVDRLKAHRLQGKLLQYFFAR